MFRKLSSDSSATAAVSTPELFDGLGLFTPRKSLDVEKPEYHQDDVKQMFQYLCRYSFQKEEFDAIDKILTITSDTCRTTRAHYRHTDFRIEAEENVCRTTVMIPESTVSYLEYRSTPDRHRASYKCDRLGTEHWTIGFKSNEEAQSFLETLYAYEPISNAQKAINKDEFKRRSIGQIATRCENIMEVKRYALELVLDFLNRSGRCPSQVIAQQKEQIEQMKSKCAHSLLK